MHSSRSRFAVVVSGLLAVAACGKTPSPAGPATSARLPSIVLLIVDTLRADALASDGGEPTPLPSLHRFAKGATTFSDAVSSAAWTPQALPSLLTGLSPSHTGCEGMAETQVPALPRGVTTLAERLQAAGYATAAFTGGGYLSASQGISQGFGAFFTSFDIHGPESTLSMWSKLRTRSVPFLLLLHTYAPHDPYGEKDMRAMASAAPPAVPASPTLGRTFSGPEASAEALLDRNVMRECAFEWLLDGLARPANDRLIHEGPGAAFLPALHRWIDGGYLTDPKGRSFIEGQMRTAYRRGLGPVDTVLARTFAALEAANLPPDTIVVVTSDHGEALGEHGYLTHERYLHDEIVRVPLLIRAPGRLPEGAVVRGTCGPVDLTPTLLELAGLPPVVEELDGRSLVAQAKGRTGGHPIVSTADRYERMGETLRSVREITVRDELRVWSYVYDVLTGDVVSEHVFDLVEDPRTLDPRPVGAFAWTDSEFCRLVAATRDEARQRFGLPPLGSPCEPTR